MPVVMRVTRNYKKIDEGEPLITLLLYLALHDECCVEDDAVLEDMYEGVVEGLRGGVDLDLRESVRLGFEGDCNADFTSRVRVAVHRG